MIQKTEFKNLNSELLNRIASNTKVKTESLSETIALNRRDLLYSINFSKIAIPIYNNESMHDVIENILLCSYLKQKYNSKILICIDFNKNKYKQIYQLFSNYFDKLVNSKKYFDIHDEFEDFKATKLIYNKSLDLIEDFDYWLDKPVSIDIDGLISDPNIEVYDSKYDYFISSNNNHQYIEEILPSLGHCILPETKISLIDKINLIINSEKYLNIANNSEVDFIVPFMNCNIFTYKTSFYTQGIFKHSVSKQNNLINKLIPGRKDIINEK